MILAELYKRNVFLPGKDQYEQIALILDYTGAPLCAHARFRVPACVPACVASYTQERVDGRG